MRNMRRRWCSRAFVSALALYLCVLPARVAAASQTPFGRLVDIGTRRIHIICEGEGHPAVILDSGLGGAAGEWAAVQHRLAKQTRVCAYDRAGYGWSDPGPLPRTSLAIAGDLHETLRRAGVPPPFVLVGHSFGGFNVRMFANRYPGETAGLVLVDASNEHEIERLQQDIGVRIVPPQGQRFTLFSPAPAPGAADLQRAYRAQRAAHAELSAFRASAAQVQRFRALPAVPLVVISRSMQPPRTGGGSPQMERAWQRLQDELLHLLPGSTQLISRQAGHFLQIQDPQLVCEGISLAVEEARKRRVPDP